MREQVLIYSRFPKALMQRIGERFELLDAAGKPPHEVFTSDQLSRIRAMVTAGGTPAFLRKVIIGHQFVNAD